VEILADEGKIQCYLFLKSEYIIITPFDPSEIKYFEICAKIKSTLLCFEEMLFRAFDKVYCTMLWFSSSKK
jgi:hypothetical protein